ncbi:MAG: porin family protein [Bacteroidales bacterium]
MKKLFILFAAFLISITAQAQRFGIKAGTDLSKISVSLEGLGLDINTGFHTGFYVGGFGTFNISDAFAIQGEAQVSYSGGTIKVSQELIDNLGGNIENYIYKHYWTEVTIDKRMKCSINSWKATVPVMIKYTSNNLSVLAGPYVSLLFDLNTALTKDGEQVKIEGAAGEIITSFTDELKQIAKETIRPVNFGLNFGIEYQFDCGLFLSGNYSFGLRNVFPLNPSENETLKMLVDLNVTTRVKTQ